MLNKMINLVKNMFPAGEVHAHCDGPCGVYDPAQARVHAEAVLSMTKKLNGLDLTDAASHNTFARYVQIKEEEAESTKRHVLVLWTDFFKPQHLEQFPDLHDVFWYTTKLCSACKHGVSEEKANELMDHVEKIHNMFWEAKGRDVEFVKANP